mgnify:CR=1 FL=1
MELIRTDSTNTHFIQLVKQLDAYLAIQDGDEHAFYNQFNQLDTIKHVIVLFHKGIAVGCGAIKKLDTERMEIKRMFTSPHSRNKGLASSILAELEQWAIELGYSKCILETGIKQHEAIALYYKNGYNLIDNYGQYVGMKASKCFEKNLRTEHLILQTERLRLRELTPDDAINFYRLNSDLEVMKYTGDSPFDSVESARQFLKHYTDYTINGFGRWAVVDKKTNSFLGWCGLKLNEENLIDIGFRFFQNEWGKGYATEAAKACLDYGFNHLNMDEIIGRAASENKASIRVLEKLNMLFWKQDNCKGIENSVYYTLSKLDYNNSIKKI